MPCPVGQPVWHVQGALSGTGTGGSPGHSVKWTNGQGDGGAAPACGGVGLLSMHLR